MNGCSKNTAHVITSVELLSIKTIYFTLLGKGHICLRGPGT